MSRRSSFEFPSSRGPTPNRLDVFRIRYFVWFCGVAIAIVGTAGNECSRVIDFEVSEKVAYLAVINLRGANGEIDQNNMIAATPLYFVLQTVADPS